MKSFVTCLVLCGFCLFFLHAQTYRFGAGGREENLSNLQNANLKWTRVPNDLRPSDIENGQPKPPVRDMFDIRVREAQEKGCKVYAILTPKPESGSYPTSANFASVLAYFVERYDMDGVNDMPGLLEPVLYWEICNEYQSTAPEWSGLSQTTYIEYCQLSRAALKTANSAAKFSAGSLVCGNMHDFSDFKAVWSAGVAVDFISYHSYFPDKFGLKDATDDLWAFDSNLKKVPFVITESAFYDNPDGLNASQYKNARWLPIACSNAFYYNAETVIYAELTANPMWTDPKLLWMTMIDKNSVKRPNYYTFVKMNQIFGKFATVDKVSNSEASFTIFRYLNPDSSTKYCAWTDESDGTTYNLDEFETRKFKKVCAVPDIDASDNVIIDENGYPTFETEILVKAPGALSFTSTSNVPYYLEPIPGNLYADFDGNGKKDLISLDNSNFGRILLMNGKNIASNKKFYSTNNANWGIEKICDFNGDGKSDLLWKERKNKKYAIYLYEWRFNLLDSYIRKS